MALVFSKFFKTKPDILAKEISLELKNSHILKIEVVKPGFVNIFLRFILAISIKYFISLQGVVDYKIPKKIFVLNMYLQIQLV